jgi:hypothetical protein
MGRVGNVVLHIQTICPFRKLNKGHMVNNVVLQCHLRLLCVAKEKYCVRRKILYKSGARDAGQEMDPRYLWRTICASSSGIHRPMVPVSRRAPG